MTAKIAVELTFLLYFLLAQEVWGPLLNMGCTMFDNLSCMSSIPPVRKVEAPGIIE